MSAPPDSTLANPEQFIADLQRQLAEREAELAECKAERDEALQRETATAEVLQVINSSPGDLVPVFDAVLERAIHLCEDAFGAFFIREGERLRAVSTRGLSERLNDFVRCGFEVDWSGPLWHGTTIEHIADLTKKDLTKRPGPRAAMELGGARTLLNFVLRKDDVLFGVFSIIRQEVRPFTDKQIALLENFAAQAVIAMENARLLTETREALEQQTATAEVLQVINSSPGDLALVFDVVLEKATRLCEAPFGDLRIWDGESFHVGAVHGEPSFREWARRRGSFRPDHDNSPLARIVGGERVVDLADATNDEGYKTSSGFRKMVDASGIRSAVTVALRKEDALLGTITVYRQEVRSFSDKQIALLQNFAAQAVIAMENARLLTETREALEQQTATAEVLGVINSSPGNLKPVFDAMLEKAIRLCEATHGRLFTYDGERFHLSADHCDAPYIERAREAGPVQPHPATPLGRLKHGERIVHVADVRQDEGYHVVPTFRETIELRGVRSQIAVALLKDNVLLGAMTVYRQEVRPFSDKQVTLLQNFAAQAVIAMENARLLGELRERTHQLEQSLEYQTATSEVLQVISRSTYGLKPVLDTLVESAARLCNAQIAGLITGEGDDYRLAATFSLSPEYIGFFGGRSWRADRRSVFGRTVLDRQIVHIADVAADPEYALPETFTIGKFRTILGVPLLREAEPIGALCLGRQRVELFTERQIELVRSFADQAVIAMENARLIGELRQRTDQVAELNRGLQARVAEQVEELGRVGRLKRFLAPQLAELIVSQGDEKILESHRREIVVVFCDLRGYTAFTETAEPEEVLDFLREYHGALGPMVSQYEGTLDQFSGDGIMVFFNDPMPIPDPAARAVNMAVAMRDAAGTLIASWRRRGRLLGFGAGIAQGYATLGQIGFAERSGYTAIGTVCNLAARLCAEAQDGQILIGQRVAVAIEETITLEEVGALTLKGLTQPVVAYNVPLAPIQPALRVIEGGPQSV